MSDLGIRPKAPDAVPGGGAVGPRPAERRAPAWLLVLAAVLLAVAAVVGWRLASKPEEPPREPARRVAPPRAPPVPTTAHARVREAPVKKHRTGKNVTVYDADRAFAGYTLFTVKYDPLALLVDMDGEVVHRWTSRVGQPDPKRPVPEHWFGWRTVRMLPNGDLVVLVDRRMLMRLDWNSQVVWQTELPVHHDVTVGPNDTLYTLTEEARMVEIGGRRRLVRDHLVTLVTAGDGSVGRSTSLFDIVMRDSALAEGLTRSVDRKFRKLDREGVAGLIEGTKPNAADDEPSDTGSLRAPDVIARLEALYETGAWKGDRFDALALLQLLPGRPSDIFHAASVAPLKAHSERLWRDGDVLVSLRNLDVVAALDLSAGAIRWQWGPGELRGQYQASLLDDGGLLVFDNGLSDSEGQRGFTRLVEVDPVAKKIRWTYEGAPRRSLSVPTEGGCQHLPNGNVLAAASSGRVFEVTHDGAIVWEYFLPKGEDGKRRTVVYRAERIAPEVVEPLLGPPPDAH